jgi:hypothetical protein
MFCNGDGFSNGVKLRVRNLWEMKPNTDEEWGTEDFFSERDIW